MMTFIPVEIPERKGILVKRKLSTIEITTSAATTMFSRAGGMIMARNMAYRAMERDEVTTLGRISPIIPPRAVPNTQPGHATDIAHTLYIGSRGVFWAMAMPKISSVTPIPISILFPVFSLGESFMVKAALIRRYLRLITRVEIICST